MLFSGLWSPFAEALPAVKCQCRSTIEGAPKSFSGPGNKNIMRIPTATNVEFLDRVNNRTTVTWQYPHDSLRACMKHEERR